MVLIVFCKTKTKKINKNVTEFEASSSQAVTIKAPDWQTTPAPPAQPAERLYSHVCQFRCCKLASLQRRQYLFAVCLQLTV